MVHAHTLVKLSLSAVMLCLTSRSFGGESLILVVFLVVIALARGTPPRPPAVQTLRAVPPPGLPRFPRALAAASLTHRGMDRLMPPWPPSAAHSLKDRDTPLSFLDHPSSISSRSVSMSEQVSPSSPMASLLIPASLSWRFFGRAWMPVASVLLVLPTLAFHVHPRSFSRSSMRSADRRVGTARWQRGRSGAPPPTG